MKAILLALAIALTSPVAFARESSDEERPKLAIEREERLVFPHFDHETAFAPGLAMVEHAREVGAPRTVFDIRRNGQIPFRASLAGSSVDNERWAAAKQATAQRFGMSSKRKKLEFRAMLGAQWLKTFPNGGGDPAAFRALTPLEAQGLVGGGFPITVEGAGYVGAFIASGEPDHTDHDFIVEVLAAFSADLKG